MSKTNSAKGKLNKSIKNQPSRIRKINLHNIKRSREHKPTQMSRFINRRKSPKMAVLLQISLRDKDINETNIIKDA